MRPTEFKEQYKKFLGAGDNPNTSDLPYCRAIDPGTPGPIFLISAWDITDEELAEISASRKMYIGIMSHPDHATQPPVVLMGKNPFTGYENNYVRLDENAVIPGSKMECRNVIRQILKEGGDPFKAEAVLVYKQATIGFVSTVIEEYLSENKEPIIGGNGMTSTKVSEDLSKVEAPNEPYVAHGDIAWPGDIDADEKIKE